MPPTSPGATVDPRFLTKQALVYTTLRDAILRCDLAPGERLVIDEFARRYAVSIIPVREALRLLQSEGLVSRDSVVEVFTLLEGLELVATRAAAERAAPDALEEIEGLVRGMDDALADGAPQRWADLNTQFHLRISEAAGMPLLQQMMQRALDHWDRVRRFYFNGVLVHRARQAQVEHRRILAQLRARDFEGLQRTIREHNQNALKAYTTYLASRPEREGAATR